MTTLLNVISVVFIIRVKKGNVNLLISVGLLFGKPGFEDRVREVLPTVLLNGGIKVGTSFITIAASPTAC